MNAKKAKLARQAALGLTVGEPRATLVAPFQAGFAPDTPDHKPLRNSTGEKQPFRRFNTGRLNKDGALQSAIVLLPGTMRLAEDCYRFAYKQLKRAFA